MPQAITDKVVIITGASSGIGRAAARRLAAEGANLVVVARSAAKLTALAQELGGETLAVPADLTVPADVDNLLAKTLERFGHIDILFANAGSYVAGDVVDGDPDAWDRVIGVNVNGVFRTVHAVLPGMIARRSGDIVVTSSISGHQAIQWEPVYSATKHAVQSFVHGVRRQIAPHNVRIGSLAPGMVLNELWGVTDEKEIERRVSEHAGLRSEDVGDAEREAASAPAGCGDAARTIRGCDLVILPQNQDL